MWRQRQVERRKSNSSAIVWGSVFRGGEICNYLFLSAQLYKLKIKGFTCLLIFSLLFHCNCNFITCTCTNNLLRLIDIRGHNITPLLLLHVQSDCRRDETIVSRCGLQIDTVEVSVFERHEDNEGCACHELRYTKAEYGLTCKCLCPAGELHSDIWAKIMPTRAATAVYCIDWNRASPHTNVYAMGMKTWRVWCKHMQSIRGAGKTESIGNVQLGGYCTCFIAPNQKAHVIRAMIPPEGALRRLSLSHLT